jgi:TM2 domain-containing membrane protein YozV
MILSCYKKANRYQDALDYLDTFNNRTFTTIECGKLYMLKNDTKKAITYFNQVNSDTAKLLKGWAYMKEGDWKTSTKSFLRITDNSHLYSIANNLSGFASKADNEITGKNVAVAALLSSIIPGAGRLYTGRTGDAFFSFFTVAVPGIISYLYWQDDRKRAFSIAVGITAVFYAGDIYGSIVSAQKYNKLGKARYLQRIENRLHIEEKLIR